MHWKQEKYKYDTVFFEECIILSENELNVTLNKGEKEMW